VIAFLFEFREIKSPYGGHLLALAPFDLTADAYDVAGFDLIFGFGSFLFASTSRNRNLAFQVDSSSFG